MECAETEQDKAKTVLFNGKNMQGNLPQKYPNAEKLQSKDNSEKMLVLKMVL